MTPSMDGQTQGYAYLSIDESDRLLLDGVPLNDDTNRTPPDGEPESAGTQHPCPSEDEE